MTLIYDMKPEVSSQRIMESICVSMDVAKLKIVYHSTHVNE